VNLLFQIFGLLLLLSGLGIGYGRWVRPYGATLGRQGKGLLLLVILTLMGGFVPQRAVLPRWSGFGSAIC